jgi:putative endonuclease
VSKENLSLGKIGEEEAVSFLRKNGYQLIKRNYKNKLGEIDIIAKDRDVLCFVEVKTRIAERFGLPQEAVCRQKQRRVSCAALCYLKENKLLGRKARFDVVAVKYQKAQPKLELIKNAFELEGSFVL